MRRRTIKIPDWNATELKIGDDMSYIDDSGVQWVVDSIGEPENGTVNISLIERSPSLQ